MKNNLWDKILITGAGGIIGSYVDFGIKTDQNNLDVSDPLSVFRLFKKHHPAVVIHLAAQTDMGVCEQNPDQCYRINSAGAYNIALAARETEAKMVYMSTDAVFDGVKKSSYYEGDTPHPVNHYGHSKHLGELAVQGILKDYILIRTSWVFGGGPKKDKKFVGKIMEQLYKQKNKDIKAVNNSKSSPAYAKDLIAITKKLIAEDKKGIFHITNSGIATRYDMAKEILCILGMKNKLLPVKSNFFRTGAWSIDTGGLISKSIRLRPWQSALREYLETEWESPNRVRLIR